MSRHLRFAFFSSLLALSAPLWAQTGEVNVNATSGTAGVVVRATSDVKPDIFAVTGSASSGSAFIIFNNANAELLRVRSDSVLVLGGATASAWDAVVSPAIEYKNTGIAFGDITDIHFLSNAYYPGPYPGSWRYKTSERAANYHMVKGTHYWRVAQAGLAESAIPWTEAMNLSSAGNLGIGIGITAAQARVQIGGASSALLLTTSTSYGYGAHFRNISDVEPYHSGVLMEMTGNSAIRVSNVQIGERMEPEIHSMGAVPLFLNRWNGNDVYLGGGTSALRVEGTGDSSFAGKLGIGITAPQATLHVQGDVFVSGNIAAKYQDVAEWVVSDADLAPGTVVVLGRERVNTVTAATEPFDTRVAGVVSEQPGLILGEAGASKEMVATTGRVRVRVDASRDPIAIGDLLVTSDRTGRAMKSVPVDVAGISMHRPGTIIGKALEPLARGEGEILVLLSLQ